jgi:hypothetical protein
MTTSETVSEKLLSNPQIREVLNLAEHTNYLNKDITYLKGVKITEYDIKSAGYTVVRYKKLLTAEELAYLDTCPKEERNVLIGKRIRDNPEINAIILDELKKARKAFVLKNGLLSDDILSIKKDAIFVIKKRCSDLTFHDFQFVPKSTYTSYAYLNGKEFYYSEGSPLTVKGASEEQLENGLSFLTEMNRIFFLSEMHTNKSIVRYLKDFANKYLNKELPVESYRDFDSAVFKLYNNYSVGRIGYEELEQVNIVGNYVKYINPLISEII